MVEQHTPGPWKLTERSGYYEILGPRQDANWYGAKGIWAVAYCDTDLDEDVTIANGNLIAAAPDLLAALREAKGLAEMAVMSDDQDGIESDDQGSLIRLRATIDAALAKATGK